MSNSPNVATANPPGGAPNSGDTDFGSQGTGLDDAARAFAEDLEREQAETRKPNRRERRAAQAREREGQDHSDGKAEQSPRQPARERQDDADDADPLRDPILDGAPPAEGEDGEDGDDGEDADDGDDPDNQEDGDDGDDDGIPEDTTFQVTVNGVPQEVPLKELLSGYSREQDYRQKTTELSGQRQLMAEFVTETQERRQTYESGIELLGGLLNSVMPSQEEWAALKKSDPAQFIQARETWEGYITKLQQFQAHQQHLQGEKEAEKKRQDSIFAAQENEKLFAKIPQLRNEEVASKFRQAVFSYGREMGFTEQELREQLVDHRHVLTAYYASRYHEIMKTRNANRNSQNAKAPKKATATSTPPAVRSNRQGGKSATNQRVQRQADDRLRRTGTIQDAAASFQAMFR